MFLVVKHLQLAVEIHVKELGGLWLHQIGLHWFTFHLEAIESWIVVSGGESYLALVRSETNIISIGSAQVRSWLYLSWLGGGGRGPSLSSL